MDERLNGKRVRFEGNLRDVSSFTEKLGSDKVFRELCFENCAVDSSLWPEIRDKLKQDCCTVRGIKIVSTSLDEESWKVVGDILKSCKTSELTVELDKSSAMCFPAIYKPAKLTALKFHLRGAEIKDVAEQLPGIIISSRAKNKEILVYDIVDEDLREAKHLGEKTRIPVDVLDISDNTATDSNWRIVVALLVACQTDELIMHNCRCNLKTTKFHAFPTSPASIRRLDASFSGVDDFTWHVIKGVVYVCNVQEMILRNCQHRIAQRGVPEEVLGVSKVNVMDLSETVIEVLCADRLVKILVDCEVERLVLRKCDFTPMALKGRLFNKFAILDVSENTFNRATCAMLAELLRGSEVKDLVMQDCTFAENSFDGFAQDVSQLTSVDLNGSDLSSSWESLEEWIKSTRGVTYWIEDCHLDDNAKISLWTTLDNTQQVRGIVQGKSFFQASLEALKSIPEKIRNFFTPSAWFRLTRLTLKLREDDEEESMSSQDTSVDFPTQPPPQPAQLRLPMPEMKFRGKGFPTFPRPGPSKEDPKQGMTSLLMKCKTQLRETGGIDLSHMPLTSQGVLQISEAIRNAKSAIKHVTCIDCDLDDGSATKLIEAIIESRIELASLVLDDNPKLGKKTAEAVANLLESKQLEEIGLVGCELEEFQNIILGPIRRGQSGSKVHFADDIAEVSQQLEANQTVVTMGRQGGKVKHHGFEIVFPANAVSRETNFTFSFLHDSEAWPSEYMALAPGLACRPSMKFNVPVKIKIPLWGSTRSSGVMLEVIRVGDHDKSLHVVSHQKLADLNREVVFECYEFSRFWALIRWALFGEVEYQIHFDLYADTQGNFKFAIMVNDDSVKAVCKKEMNDRNFHLTPAVLNNMTAKSVDHLESRLQCENPDVDTTRDFAFGDQFAKDSKAYLSFCIQPIPEHLSEIHLTLTLRHNNKTMLEEFNMVWEAAGGPENDPRQIVYQGPVTAHTIVLGGNADIRD